MRFKSVSISRWTETQPPSGTVHFSGDHGEISLKLDEEFCAKILEVCAEALIAESQRRAAAMTTELLQRNAIEHKPDAG